MLGACFELSEMEEELQKWSAKKQQKKIVVTLNIKLIRIHI